ncbi:MAG: polysaccharide deacetylase [Sulfitobacter sp.]
MKIDWSPLLAELGLWRREGLPLPVWWRDDDAVAETPALSRLQRLSEDLGVAVHVAVIPGRLEDSLLPAMTSGVPMVHGWTHISHSPQGVKNAEFGQPRKEAAGELVQAMAVMQAAFGEALLPVFVPPWNRIDASIIAQLKAAGYAGLSTYGPRKAPLAAEGVAQINTHIDPIFWKGHRGLAEPETLIAGIVQTLRDRRTGRTDATEPLGLLTHHLVHTEDVWDFSAEVLQVLLDGGAVPAALAAHLAPAP